MKHLTFWSHFSCSKIQGEFEMHKSQWDAKQNTEEFSWGMDAMDDS